MKRSENFCLKSLEGPLKCLRIRLTYFNVTVKWLKKASCVSDYSYPLSFLLRGCVREIPCFYLSLFLFLSFFLSKRLRKGYLFGQKRIERNKVGPQGWVSPCRWVAPTERRLFLDKRSDNIIILHSVWASQKFNRWWWSFGFYNQEESTGKRVLSYTPHYFSGCRNSCKVRNGHVPLTSLSFSMASSTTYSDERCSSVFVHSRACESHLQLFGRQRGIAFRSSPVLTLAVPVATNEKW